MNVLIQNRAGVGARLGLASGPGAADCGELAVTKGMVMKRSVSVRLSAFAIDALAGRSATGSNPASADVLRAIQFYLGQSRRQAPGWAYPAFMRGQSPGVSVEFDLDVDDVLWALLAREASKQEITVEQLLEHAAMYYAAQMDSGWTGERPHGRKS